ncbi:hypothetical protein KOX_04620 [Klebsiella michiganensis KCTC 1686]|uniref:Uncharacterized protein n=1 Tax=Klebsiella michiganensis (strain ATCC 8724 / DSM 4798 / JCM 20051 / NBRC 3318 / NRRL B-199 / KCTC 1686 / BUCSAV 143 / CCM 1901) TaxID=1006551 RepID=A0A0H3GZQ7_KLEM8|nr:hypothetical protein KOX_04620 [Klebsiella michiganensis KCTC 1686]
MAPREGGGYFAHGLAGDAPDARGNDNINRSWV